MKTVSFIVKQKPVIGLMKWNQDEGNGDWWCEYIMESDYQLEKGDHIYIEDLEYCIYKRAYYLAEDIWTYYLDPVYRLSI